MTYKILISDPLHPAAVDWLKAQPDAEVIVQPQISCDELREIIADFDALIVRGRTQVGAEEIRRGRQLRVIGRAGTGLDNIDVQAAEKRAIQVLNAPGANANAVAELTLGLMLALARHLREAFASRKKLSHYGWELQGKTLGIVGLGRIGSRVAHLAHAFGMSLIAHEPDPDAGPKDLPLERVALGTVLRRSDVITLHVPLLAETRLLLDGPALHGVKRGAVVVNTARAEVVDEGAILDALEKEQILGYASDVYKDPRLIGHPRVVLTPHVGAQTEEAQQRAGQQIAERVVAALRRGAG